MRDDHLDRYHQEQTPEQKKSLYISDPDCIQPLLFDLIQKDDVDSIRDLLPYYPKANETHVGLRRELIQAAAEFGSSSLVELLLAKWPDIFDKFYDKIAIAAIEANNIEVFNHVLHRYSKNHRHHHNNIYSLTLPKVLVLECSEMYDIWEKHATIEPSTLADRMGRPLDLWRQTIAFSFTTLAIYSAAAGHPHREEIIIKMWKKKGVLEALGSVYLGDALHNLAQTSCSVKIAKVLINAGANVNHRRSQHYPTPLHYAARQTSAEAAEFMKFLLLSGATADVEAGRKRGNQGRLVGHVKDERGTKGISKHLGISWDELIAQSKAEREKGRSRARDDGKENQVIDV